MTDSEDESDFASAESEPEEDGDAVADGKSNSSEAQSVGEEKVVEKESAEGEGSGRKLNEGGFEGEEGEGGGSEGRKDESELGESVKEESHKEDEIKEHKTQENTTTKQNDTPKKRDFRNDDQNSMIDKSAKTKEVESDTEQCSNDSGPSSIPPTNQEEKNSMERTAEPVPVVKGEQGERKGGEGGGGGGGGWGWGGWGKSLWSSVSTVTESAQVLGQKVTAAITTVEDALGLPSPLELATNTEEEREGREEVETGDVQTLAELAEKIVESDASPQTIPQAGSQVEPESDQTQRESATTIGAFSGFISGIATAVEQRGIQLMSGGLDALENIGKKTMEVLTEGDPGFQNKRKLLKGDTPSLSALLREAKAEAEAKQNETEVPRKQAQQSYSSLFDEYHGVVHLEALELLSKEYAAKVRGCLPSLVGEEGEWVEQQMELVAQALIIKESEEGLAVLDDDSGKLEEIVELFSDTTPHIKVDKLVKVSEFWHEKLQNMSTSDDEDGKSEGEKESRKTLERDSDESEKREESEQEKEEDFENKQLDIAEEEKEITTNKLSKEDVYENGLRGLVEMTSVSIELFRKMAEISLLPQAKNADTIKQANKFNRLTVLVSSELDALASVHAEVLTDIATEDINSTITSLYLESSNSVSYVQDALQLLKPVLQYTVLQEVALQQPGPNVHSRS